MRLIDADALKEKICNNVYPITDFFNSRDYGMFWTGGIEKAIDEAPTIDAEPVRHGKWIYKEFEQSKVGYYECSECGYVAFNEKSCHYCYNCGAKMEGEETDETD